MPRDSKQCLGPAVDVPSQLRHTIIILILDLHAQAWLFKNLDTRELTHELVLDYNERFIF